MVCRPCAVLCGLVVLHTFAGSNVLDPPLQHGFDEPE